MARSDGVVAKKGRRGAVPFPIQQIRRGDHRSPVAYFSIATPQSALPTAPLNGSLANCLSLRRGGTQCRSGGFVWNGTLDVTFQHYRERPMVAPTTVLHCPKIQKREVSDFSFLLFTILNPLISIPFHHKFINFIKHYKFLQTPQRTYK